MSTKKEKAYLRKAIMKWSFLIFLIVFLTVLQCSKCFNFNDLKPFFVFPLAIGFFMFNNIKNSTIFAVICGFFMDCFSDRPFGFSSLFLIISCVIISLSFKKFMQIRILNFVFINSTFFLAFEIINFFLLYISLSFKNIWFIWVSHIFPTCALTILVSPFFYLICKKINKISKKSKNATTINDQLYYESEL